LGCWFSVGPAMLASSRGSALVAEMPRDRVLTETDGPFAKKGGVPLEPNDVLLAVRMLSELWKCPATSVHETLGSNFDYLRQAVSAQ
jgi:TatD DNase family protein